jgi:hypothetical protein
MGTGRSPSGGTRFRAPYDTTVALLTLTFSVIVLGVAVVSVRTASVFGVAIAAGCVLLLLLCWMYGPTAYRVEPDALVIERPAGEHRVSLDGLVEVTRERRRPPITLKGYRVGGLFGVYGRLYTRRTGWISFWGRRVSGTVTLRFPNRSVIVMPDDPEEFIASLSALTH